MREWALESSEQVARAATQGNRTLPERSRLVWEGRRRRLEKQHKAANAELARLNIPLYRDPNAKGEAG
jgi:hypothetical protein